MPDFPVEISGSADAEFVSGTQVRLAPGFHAGAFTGSGRFRAHIDAGLGPPGDVVVITPDPAVGVHSNILHVPKWEKLEIGMRLPQVYQDAITNFFGHYYSNGVTEPATPNVVDAAHDLNPYADDSLQLVMLLTGPSGQRMKWGFFMREAGWENATDIAQLMEDTDDPLHPYHIRFRFAPDVEGPWEFTLSLKAPHTQDVNDQLLPDQQHTGYQFHCGAPLPDNQGPLRVHPVNKRLLQYAESEEPFFALGVNMADTRNNLWGANGGPSDHWYSFHKRDHDGMLESMDLLHDVGGNFLRMFLMRNIFAPEWVNLGVYDAYRTPQVCDQSFPTSCTNGGWTTDHTGNCQYQGWAFDQILEQARANSIYIQLCIDPYPPIVAFERFLWGAHPYAVHFLEPNRQTPPDNPYNMRRFFYTNGDSAMVNDPGGVFYYWKRKYKYIMNRWGYSVNLPIIEPFNEMDQMLSYRAADLEPAPGLSCAELENAANWDICMENRVDWSQDAGLPRYVSSWLNDITTYVRGGIDVYDPVHSPLGESGKLFLMSYGGGEPASGSALFYLPLRNPNVDLIDAHKGLYPALQGPNNELTRVDRRIHEGVQHADSYWQAQPGTMKKPFSQGEFNHYTNFTIPNPIPGQPDLWNNEVEKIFHNYDVSFHNELWSSAFSGKFAAGTTWHWERVFWWPDALPEAPEDDLNLFQPNGEFSSDLGDDNRLDIGPNIPGIEVVVKNRRIHHHFQPLTDLLSHPGVSSLGVLSDAFTPHVLFDGSVLNPDPIECYYLMNSTNTAAIGWVHNRTASVARSFYVKKGPGYNHNFLGALAPTNTSIALQGFQTGQDYYVYWFPTRMNATAADLPDDYTDDVDDGQVLLDLSSMPFGGTVNNYLDTLHADYAFVISPVPITRSLMQANEGPFGETEWDFALFPNPAQDGAWLQFEDDAPKDAAVFDAMGRELFHAGSVSELLYNVDLSAVAKGLFWVRVSNGKHVKARRLIIQ
ncbi:MAG: T9SS type A sorting domain-containing protein [Flavobacteriales bacterium]|nr:T9SS type A sorting domain-containing protein [Flavobacteriales bacterium]